MSETTYCLATNQPTNQPVTGTTDIPEEYTSMRITIAHSRFQELHDNVLHDLSWYISYPHTGKDRSNEHYHVFFVAGITERLRKRVKSYFGPGNGVAMFKSFKNGLTSGIQYASKEGSLPYIVGSECDEWIACAPPWVQRNAALINAGINQRQVKEDHFRIITYTNMEKLCLRYRNQNGLKTKDLAEVLAHMHENGYRLQYTVLKNGIVSTVYEQFTKACDGGTIYCAGRFNRMRCQERWKEGF